MRNLGLMLGLSALAATGVYAEEVGHVEQQTTGKPADERVVCKSQEITGSRLRTRKVCMTRDQ